MAVPGARMRLTVVVEALAEENAHGEYRDRALAAFKERKFAMPVQLEDSFETVWHDIEQRYRTNYLSAQQAAAFSIKKLQDAYDCDLDMTDTVGAIFEGEPDRKMHMIKVIPHFVYRETSVLPGSMLRPTGAQKRAGEDPDDGAHKRRRVASQPDASPPRQHTHEASPPRQHAYEASPSRPLPSTESQLVAAGAAPVEARQRATRSQSGTSLLELRRAETGHAPFSAAAVKQESPTLHGPDAASPRRAADRLLPPLQPTDDHVPPGEHQTAADAQAAVQEPPQLDPHEATPESLQPPESLLPPAPPQLDPHEAAIQQSPVSSVEPEPAPAPATRSRRDVYRVPSSPDFMHNKPTPDKPARTYARSPRSGAHLLNMARRLGRPAEDTSTTSNGAPASITNKARAFQRPHADEIESTPHEEANPGPRENSRPTGDDADDDDADDDDADLTASFLDEAAAPPPTSAETPARKPPARHAKPGTLKKPSRASLVATPTSTRRATKSKAAATPASASANRSSAKGKAQTSLSVRSSKGEDRQTMLARLEKMMNAAQHSTKAQGSPSSPARSASATSQKQSNRSSPELHIPVTKETQAPGPNIEAIDARLAIQPPTAQRTPTKSPLPLPTLPPSTRKPTFLGSTTSDGAVTSPKAKEPDVFKKPAARVRKSPASTPAARNVSGFTSTLRRSEVPFPTNVRHLRRSGSSQSSPFAKGASGTNKSSPSASVKRSAKSTSATPSSEPKSSENAVSEPAGTTCTAKPANGVINISSAESSSTDSSDSEDEGHEEDREHPKPSMDGVVQGESAAAGKTTQQDTGDSDDAAPEETARSKTLPERESLETRVTQTLTQNKPSSGQETGGAAPWAPQSWSFGDLGKANSTNAQSEQTQEPAPEAAIAPASGGEEFAEQDIYSTAIEDNASRSRSASAAASTRSSPAVSRRPARFLSHSPTPDASESEDDSDEASAARVASPQINDKGESESESDSSSDSSDDEDVQTPDLPTESTTDSNARPVPPSSPPLDTFSTPIVPETSQSTPSQIHRPTQRTPIPPPTQQSQAPRSSQSVSVQAADRRRYTGFRSLREQLADTKAAQATTQKKTFDPRTMSLAKLAKGKPLAGLGGDDQSSDDESSSSSGSE